MAYKIPFSNFTEIHFRPPFFTVIDIFLRSEDQCKISTRGRNDRPMAEDENIVMAHLRGTLEAFFGQNIFVRPTIVLIKQLSNLANKEILSCRK